MKSPFDIFCDLPPSMPLPRQLSPVCTPSMSLPPVTSVAVPSSMTEEFGVLVVQWTPACAAAGAPRRCSTLTLNGTDLEDGHGAERILRQLADSRAATSAADMHTPAVVSGVTICCASAEYGEQHGRRRHRSRILHRFSFVIGLMPAVLTRIRHRLRPPTMWSVLLSASPNARFATRSGVTIVPRCFALRRDDPDAARTRAIDVAAAIDLHPVGVARRRCDRRPCRSAARGLRDRVVGEPRRRRVIFVPPLTCRIFSSGENAMPFGASALRILVEQPQRASP